MSKPKILYFDLETLPIPDRVIEILPSIGNWPGRTMAADINSILCFGYKWEGQKKAKSINAWDFSRTWKVNRNNDIPLLKEALPILLQADQIVTFNGIKFDEKFFKTRVLSARAQTKDKETFILPPNIHHVDVMRSIKRHTKLYSNRLKDVNKFFNVMEKGSAGGWDVWARIANGTYTNRDLKDMDKYCKTDVDSMVELYKETMPLHGPRVINHNVFVDKDNPVCPNCGSHNLKSNGRRHTSAHSYTRLICGDCGTWSRTDLKGRKPRAY